MKRSRKVWSCILIAFLVLVPPLSYLGSHRPRFHHTPRLYLVGVNAIWSPDWCFGCMMGAHGDESWQPGVYVLLIDEDTLHGVAARRIAEIRYEPMEGRYLSRRFILEDGRDATYLYYGEATFIPGFTLIYFALFYGLAALLLWRLLRAKKIETTEYTCQHFSPSLHA